MYNESVKVHFNNLSILQGKVDNVQYAKILALIAHDYGMLGQFEKAIQYFESSNSICREHNLTSVLADNLMQLGNTYSKLNKEYSFVLPFYAEARALYTNSTFESNKASVDVNEAIYRMGKGEYTYPAKVLPEVLNLFENMGAKNQMSDICASLGDLYKDRADSAFIQDGISLKKSYQLSISYYNRAIELAHEIGAFRKEVEALRNLSTVYERTGELKLALENFKKSVIINDSIYSLANQDELLRNEYTYFQRKRELEVEQERDELARITAAEINKQQQQRNVFAIIGALILVSAIGGYRLIQTRRRAEKQRIEAEFQLVVRDTEMKALRAQMNPHFIFNSLNSISGYIARNDLKLADDYLTKFAKLMRMVLENSEHKQISLADDLKALELYMKLEAMRLPKPLKVHFEVDPEIDQQETLIPPLILQPFVENSIWHGLSKADYEGEIIISIKKEKDMLICSVQDNGVGISTSVQNTAKGNKSMGMKITQARLDALNHAKPSIGSVKMTSLEQGTRVEVVLPLETRF
jgi:tetratricopeptide (TPR) repeat protein